MLERQRQGIDHLRNLIAVNYGSIWHRHNFSSKWKQSLYFFVPSGPEGITQAKPVSGTLAKIVIARLLY